MENNPIYILYLTIVVIIYLLIDHLFFRKEAVIKRKLKNKKDLKISEVKDGDYITFKGKVVAGTSLLNAKLSNQKCVYYCVQLQTYSSENTFWHTESEEHVYQQFFLDVNGEYIIIQPDQIYRDYNKIYATMEDQKPPESLENFLYNFKYILQEYEKDGYDWKANKKKYLRFREGTIEVDETIAVKGIAQWKMINEEIENHKGSKILTLTGTKKNKLIITDISNIINKTT